MKTSRILLSYAGVLGLVSISQGALGQTTPAPSAPATEAPAAASGSSASSSSSASSPSSGETSVAPSGTAGLGLAAPATLAPAPLPAVEAAPVEPKSEKAESFPKKLAAAKVGWLQVGVLAQAWYVFEQGKALGVDTDSGKTIDNSNYFRIRRAQLKLSGAIVPDRFEYLMLADFAKGLKGSKLTNADGTTTGYYASGQDSSPLLDFLVTLKTDYADFSIGQWKSPISYEANTSSADLILPERSHAARYFGDNYDSGFKVEKKFEYVKYSAQVLQGGSSANVIDTNKQKDLALRLEFYPIAGLFVGGAGLASVGQRDTQKSTREIIEVDAGYDKDGILIRGEALWSKKGATDDPKRVTAQGMSLSAAYTIAKKFQPAVRIGYLNVDQTIDPAKLPLFDKFQLKSDEVRSYEVGFNYMLDGKHAKLMAAYGYVYPDKKFTDPRQQVTIAAQAAF